MRLSVPLLYKVLPFRVLSFALEVNKPEKCLLGLSWGTEFKKITHLAGWGGGSAGKDTSHANLTT